MQNTIDKMKLFCYCYKLFTFVQESSTLYIHNQLISQSLESGLHIFLNLDSCSIVNKIF